MDDNLSDLGDSVDEANSVKGAKSVEWANLTDGAESSDSWDTSHATEESKLMAESNATDESNSVEKDKDVYYNAVYIVLHRIMDIGDEVKRLMQHVKDLPGDASVLQCEPYDRYPILQFKADRLTTITDIVESLVYVSHLPDNPFEGKMRMQVHLARSLSLQISNMTATTLRNLSTITENLFNDKEEVASQDMVSWHREISALLLHSAKATSSVWHALDILARLLPNPMPKENTPLVSENAPSRHSRTSVLVFVIMVLALVTSVCNLMSARGSRGGLTIEDIVPIYDALDQNFAIAAQLSNRSLTMEQIFQSNSERIDNLWDSLGPPNENGTYYSAEGHLVQGVDINRRLKELHQKMEAQIKEIDKRNARMHWILNEHVDDVDNRSLQAKKEMQRADLRVHRRLTRLENRGN